MRFLTFGRRLGAGLAAGVSGAALAVGTQRLLIRAGLLPPLPALKGDAPSRSEFLGLLALAGALNGAGYAVARPLLPRRPELAGLTYAFAADALLRLQVDWILRAVGRPPRPWRAERIPWTVADGLWLSSWERIAGTSPGSRRSK
jgi:hypothetical protein